MYYLHCSFIFSFLLLLKKQGIDKLPNTARGEPVRVTLIRVPVLRLTGGVEVHVALTEPVVTVPVRRVVTVATKGDI
ncbi:hypothetical protein D0T60_14370 [Bacteroides sp. 224]|nr:hypothetical protein [Bacteroides sp. 224]